ncbi:regulatory protein RecX [Pseudoalteromonas sp.]|uniref:regulatory protein RecX n=1 Tax=Pseudoalteromonas sp. TaxID=53249 RepID=UPI0035675385
MTEKEQAKLKNYVLWLLSRQEYSKAQIAKKLATRCEDNEFIEKLILWCEDYGFIDDIRYAESFVRRQINKGLGLMRIKNEAYQKGVSADLVQTIVEELEIDWYLQAQSAYNKKFTNTSSSLDFKEKAKRIRYMNYRGFNHEQIEFAMQTSPSNE